jgi:hypothetical protein
MAKQTFMARVKAYRKLHPRTSQVEAMQKLAGKKTTRSKAHGTVKARKPVARKKSVVVTKKVTVIGSARRKSPAQKVNSSYTTGMSIIRKINAMEAKLKKLKNRDERSFLIVLINAEHDRLDLLKKRVKKSA